MNLYILAYAAGALTWALVDYLRNRRPKRGGDITGKLFHLNTKRIK